MTSTFTESSLTFTFREPEWVSVVKWDEDATYTGAQQALAGQVRRSVRGCGRVNCRWPNGRADTQVSEATRAVDFAAHGPHGRPWLIEVKVLRGGGSFEPTDERAYKIAAKVRDSLAGIMYAKARPPGIPAPGLTAVRAKFRSSRNVQVLVVFDIDGATARQRALQTTALDKALRRQLGWLYGSFSVINTGASVPGLGIRATP